MCVQNLIAAAASWHFSSSDLWARDGTLNCSNCSSVGRTFPCTMVMSPSKMNAGLFCGYLVDLISLALSQFNDCIFPFWPFKSPDVWFHTEMTSADHYQPPNEQIKFYTSVVQIGPDTFYQLVFHYIIISTSFFFFCNFIQTCRLCYGFKMTDDQSACRKTETGSVQVTRTFNWNWPLPMDWQTG